MLSRNNRARALITQPISQTKICSSLQLSQRILPAVLPIRKSTKRQALTDRADVRFLLTILQTAAPSRLIIRLKADRFKMVRSRMGDLSANLPERSPPNRDTINSRIQIGSPDQRDRGQIGQSRSLYSARCSRVMRPRKIKGRTPVQCHLARMLFYD